MADQETAGSESAESDARTELPSAADATHLVPSGEHRDTQLQSLDQSVSSQSGRGDQEVPEDFGRYRILSQLGAGGMGQVFLALDTQLDRKVALKVPRIGQDKDAIDRFYREARSMASLNHANICPVHDVGQHAGIHYLTMACIQGETLADVLGDPDRASAINPTGLFRTLALALAEAHRAGVIHRDLKPANIMIDQRGEPIVMDFGLARLDRHSEPHLTQDGSMLGTPAYMPPEQIEGRMDDIGPSSDVYSLGMVLYELLAGELPFKGGAAAVMAHILFKDPPAPSSIRQVPNELERICLRSITRKQADRFQTMDELVAALDAADASMSGQPARRSAGRPLVPGFLNDILVCCCSLDDEPAAGSAEGWVSTLVDNLRWRLRQLCGQPDAISVRVESGDSLDDARAEELVSTLHESATVLFVLSRGWLQSGWGTAATAVHTALRKELLPAHRVFLVEREQVNPTELPDILQGIRACSFRTPSPADATGEDDYYVRIDDLGRSIHSRLGAMLDGASAGPDSVPVSTAGPAGADVTLARASGTASAPPAGSSTPPPASVPPVAAAPTVARVIHFAEVTDDVDPLREDLVRYATQFEFTCLPDVWYSRDPAEFERQVEADLQQSLMFVQLVGEFPGRRPAGMPHSYAQLQYNVAQRMGLPIMQWRSPDLDVQKIADADHRALVNGSTVQAVDIEQFKRDVLDAVRVEVRKREAKHNPSPEVDDAFVFVNVDPDDMEIAEALGDLLEQSGCSYALPMHEGRPAEIREDLEANLLECDALIVVYGEITEQWVREQLRQWRKMKYRRDQPLRVLAVFQGPPREKQPLGMKLPRMQTIDCRDGLQESNLREFLEGLASQ